MRIVVASLVTLAVAASAHAQSAATVPTAGQAPAKTWSVSGGYEWFALRDISRGGRPVDASPIAWRGSGPALMVGHARERASSLHRFELSTALVGRFEYRSPLQSVDRSGTDRYRGIEGRYEYRRVVFQDRAFRGLDVGVGVQGITTYSVLARHVPVDIEATRAVAALGPAFAVGARVRRWSAVSFSVDWINGGLIGRVRDGHSESAVPNRVQWGGGWLTDFITAVDVHVTRRAVLAVRYGGSGSGLLSTHESVATSRGSVTAGVTYAQ